MVGNENALTQPKFELGISGIIHNVGKKIIIFHGRGRGAPLHGKFHENN